MLAGPRRFHPGDLWSALLFMLPAFVLVLAFTYVPFARAISLSFFVVNRNTFRPAHFMGLAYYLRVLNIGGSPFGDLYLRSLLTTLSFTLMVVPLSIVAAVALALLAQARFRRIGAFRIIFMSTVSISVASASVIWSLIYSPDLGLFRGIMSLLHLNATSMLTDARTALAAVALTTIWTSLGFNFVIAFAGLQGISRDLYESCMIDGAGRWTTLRKLTLPLLGPTLLFLLVITTISCFEAFTQFKVLIDSVGPDKSTNVLVYAIFDSFWMQNDYGFASAMSVVLFFVILGLTVSQMRLDRKVHYQ
ncbi:MAG TPA: sugar ABC transporter permease [Spirochaetia bacterium]|nr:sugar ABC transporter permease [Spirochaetia bacterium]